MEVIQKLEKIMNRLLYNHGKKCWTISIKPYLREHLYKFIPENCIKLISDFLQRNLLHTGFRCNECGNDLDSNNIYSPNNIHKYFCSYNSYQLQFAIFPRFFTRPTELDIFCKNNAPQIVRDEDQYKVCINSRGYETEIDIWDEVEEYNDIYKKLPEDLRQQFENEIILFTPLHI